MSNNYLLTNCVYGDKKEILKIYYKFQQLIESNVISQANPWMGNIVKFFGKNPEDYPCRYDYLRMYIRDYDNEGFTRLYIDTYGYSSIQPEIIEMLIDAAGVDGKINYASACEGVDEVHYYPDDSVSYLFTEPSDEALMNSINSYWVEETPAAEVAECMFIDEFTVGDDLDAFLSHYGELSSQDYKILSWDQKDHDSFVYSFSNDELHKMYDYLYRHPYHPIDYDFNYDDYEDKYSLVYDYICHWLYDILNDGVFGDRTNARKLLEAAIAMG